jgi:hypothetical protein
MQDNRLELTRKMASKLLRYFELLVEEEGKSWETSRDVARRWVSVVDGNLDPAEIEQIYNILEDGINSQGSAWHELFLEVKKCREWILSQRDS